MHILSSERALQDSDQLRVVAMGDVEPHHL
jgi:hypothetical protein